MKKLAENRRLRKSIRDKSGLHLGS
jgi:hypothetical protein